VLFILHLVSSLDNRGILVRKGIEICTTSAYLVPMRMGTGHRGQNPVAGKIPGSSCSDGSFARSNVYIRSILEGL